MSKEEVQYISLFNALGIKCDDIEEYVKELLNTSYFENSMSDLITVDIYNGINEFKEIPNIKSQSEREELISRAYKDTGIKYVSERIKHYLIDSKIAKNVLVEYSLISSTLNPQDPDKLQCCSFILTKDDRFKKNVEDYYTACIAETVKEYDISIYQHPNFLFDIPAPEVGNRKLRYIQTNSDDSKNWKSRPRKRIINVKNNPFLDVKGVNGLSITAFPLDRSYIEMTDNAREYASRKKSYTLRTIQEYLHSCCQDMITKSAVTAGSKETVNPPLSSTYVSFPIFGAKASNQPVKYKVGKDNPLQGIGACFIYFEPNPKAKSLANYDQLVDDIIRRIVYEVGKVIRFISSNYLFNLGLALQDNARKESLKSAKAAIMSRNMSHNLGSHVMSYLKQHLSSVKDMINDRVLSELYTHDSDLPEKYRNRSDEVALPFLIGLGQFVSYLQERQDFIATIATDYIPYYAEVNFKDFIYDELNPDKRVERHTDRTSSLKTDNILLGNIARSEGLGRPTSPTRLGEDAQVTNGLNDIVLKYRDFNGNSPQSELELKDLDDMRHINVSLPGGVVGRQAVFSIVENVIRNAAKHGNWRECQKLELTFDIYSKDDYQRKAPNNDAFDADKDLSLREVLKKFYCDAKDGDDLYFVTITDNLAFDDKTLEKLRAALSGKYVNEKGEMENANKGLKEMRISASWLRSINDDTEIRPMAGDLRSDKSWVNRPDFVAPVLYARISFGHLQYIFCLMKPKKVAIISTIFDEEHTYNKKEFIKNCWGAYTSEQFINLNNKSYEFVIFDDRRKDKRHRKNNEEEYKQIRRVSSSRLFKYSELPELKGLFEDIKKRKLDSDRIEKLLYEHISKSKDSLDIIVVSDQTASDKFVKKNKSMFSLIGKDKKDANYLIASDGIGVGLIGRIQSIRKNSTMGDQNLCLYRSHYETKENFVELMSEKAFNDYVFIESITGNNSTDRLVRNEELNDMWFYKHLHAMKERVAIFDERIFSKLYGLEEVNLSQSELEVPNITPENFYDIIDACCSNPIFSEEEKTDIGLCETSKELEEMLSNKAKSMMKSLDEMPTKTNIPTLFEQKRIYVFTLIKDPKQSKVFNLYGLRNDSRTVIKKQKDDYKSTCVKLYSLSWNSDNMSLTITRKMKNRNIRHKFDSLSIHQGLLDKLYEAFGIGEKDIQAKECLTRDFYTYFCSEEDKKIEQKIIEFSDNEGNRKYYLPGMCIHSGRSKPSEYNMPQHLPFIQYASIEHAVLDCKYSLVELLDFARYES